MGVMRRSSDSNVGLVTFGPSRTSEERTSWCPSCAKVGLNSPLRNRIYLDEKGNITSPQSDAKNWRQCWQCSLIVPVYEAKVEADIETLTEPTTNPFNNASSTNGSEQAEESIQPDESRLKRQRKKKLNQDLEQYKEQDIKDALRKGQKLISYVET